MAANAGAIRAGRAFVELFTDDRKLVRGLRRAQARVKAFGAAVAAMGRRLMMLGAAAAAPLLVASKVFASTGDDLAKMSQRTGMSVEALSELKFAAGQSGTSIDALETGLKRMQRTVYDAGRGLSTATDALADLGLSVGDLEGLAPEAQFKRLADRISKIEDPSRRAALALTIFGRAGTQLLPLFSQGAAGIERLQDEARRLGLTMSTADAEAAVQFKDALGRLWATVQMGVFRIGSALAPVLQRIAGVITDLAAKAGDWITRNRQVIVTALGIAAAVTAAGLALVILGKVIGGLAAALGVLKAAVAAVMLVFKGLALLASPIGAVVAAVGALGAYLVVSSGAGGKALNWLGDRFAGLKDRAMTAWGGIGDALAAGDIGLAVKVLWLTIKMEFTRGVNALEQAWLTFRNFFIKIGYDAWHGVLAVADIVWHNLKVGWIESIAWLKGAWVDFQQFWQRFWVEISTAAKRVWGEIKAFFGSDEGRAEVEAAKADRQKRLAAIDQERAGAFADLEADRQKKRAAETERHERRLAEIGEANARKKAALDEAQADRLKKGEEALKKAQEEWAAAIAEARRKREAKDAAGPDGPGGPPAMPDLDGLLTAAIDRATTRGTFYAFAVGGLDVANDAALRTASATERTARNTDRLARRPGPAFSP